MERPASYYDETYESSSVHSWRDYRSVRQRLYKAATGMIESGTPLVIDLGCGPGHFAEYLHEFLPGRGIELLSYWGFDFSPVAIRKAQNIGLPGHFKFEAQDLLQMEFPLISPDAAFVLMEVLEHIEYDMDVLDLIPAGCTCIVSVPEFDDPAHVRTFPHWGAVADRYGDRIDIKEMRRIWKWHLFKGVKK